MKLENFELLQPFGGIELQGLGHVWDLHNFAHFKGLTFVPERNELILEWRIERADSNVSGKLGNTAGCRLRFRGCGRLT